MSLPHSGTCDQLCWPAKACKVLLLLSSVHQQSISLKTVLTACRISSCCACCAACPVCVLDNKTNCIDCFDFSVVHALQMYHWRRISKCSMPGASARGLPGDNKILHAVQDVLPALPYPTCGARFARLAHDCLACCLQVSLATYMTRHKACLAGSLSLPATFVKRHSAHSFLCEVFVFSPFFGHLKHSLE